jgi:hypothetical protein
MGDKGRFSCPYILGLGKGTGVVVLIGSISPVFAFLPCAPTLIIVSILYMVPINVVKSYLTICAIYIKHPLCIWQCHSVEEIM